MTTTDEIPARIPWEGPDIERGVVWTSRGYVAYRARGSGLPLILLHASARSSAMYVPALRLLAADDLRVIAMDLPGYGDADKLPQPPTMEDFSTTVHEFAAGLGLGRYVVGGIAMGAYISVDMAVRYPDEVAGIIVQSAPYYHDLPFAEERHRIAHSAYNLDETGFPLPRSLADIHERDMIHAPAEPSQDWLDQENTDQIKAGRTFWDGMPVVRHYDLVGNVAKVACPTLFLWGKDFLYAQNREPVLEQARDASVALLPDAGLFPYQDTPEAYRDALTGFVDEHVRPTLAKASPPAPVTAPGRSKGAVRRGMVRTSAGHIHYREAGEGQPVVLLHASPRSSAMFAPVLPRLAPHVHAIAIDALGYGDSDHPTQRPSVPDYADVLREVLLAKGLERVTLAGLATGAYIGVDLAVRYPEMVDRLVLQSCPFYPTFDQASWRHAIALAAFQLDRSGFPIPRTLEELVTKDRIHAPAHPTQEWLDQDNTDLVKAGRGFWDGMRAVAAYDLAGALPQVTQPTLLLWGKDFLYAERKDDFTARLKDAKVVLVPGAGLFPQIDNPEAYDAALLGFMGV